MPTIITRAQAGLPPVPASVGHRSLSSWRGIKVHHTGGAFSTWRAIYDWQVRNRPPSERLIDVGYNFGIADGRVTELRGWARSPAHDHENSTIGVVLGGNYQSALPPAADLDALVWFCREARVRTGKQLPITGHRDTWPRGDSRFSSCPGDRLYAWLPTLRARVDDNEEDDMQLDDQVTVQSWIPGRWADDSLKDGKISVNAALGSGYGHSRAANEQSAKALKEIATLRGEVAGLTTLVQQLITAPPVDITPEQLEELVRQTTAAARQGAESALERVRLDVVDES